MIENEQSLRKLLIQEEKGRKRICKNIIDEVFYDELFIVKTSNQDHDGKTFIMDSSAMSHMVNSEENITNLKDAKTRVTVGDSRTLTKKKCVS